MQTNAFGKISEFSLTAEVKDEKTILKDVRFTAAYKIMQPFEKKDGSIEVMMMAASAGIMEGDCQELQFQIGTGAKVEFRSQSYDKIHQMKEGYAERQTKIDIKAGGIFFFHPQPVIPFRDSAFKNKTEISSGRSARGENFAYRFYHNLTEIRRKGRLIYRDNTRYVPSEMPMKEIGLYEGYTHILNLFISRLPQGEEFFDFAQELLKSREGAEGGITRLEDGDFAIRALAYRAQILEEISNLLFLHIRK